MLKSLFFFSTVSIGFILVCFFIYSLEYSNTNPVLIKKSQEVVIFLTEKKEKILPKLIKLYKTKDSEIEKELENINSQNNNSNKILLEFAKILNSYQIISKKENKKLENKDFVIEIEINKKNLKVKEYKKDQILKEMKIDIQNLKIFIKKLISITSDSNSHVYGTKFSFLADILKSNVVEIRFKNLNKVLNIDIKIIKYENNNFEQIASFSRKKKYSIKVNKDIINSDISVLISELLFECIEDGN